tara:strand:+ start:377 stop:622 length:246 start_codon:yes stop_codon:yes gene_type:complete
MELPMPRFGQMTWQSSARLVALACWACALALTGGMGWHAWTSIQETSGPYSYGVSQLDTAITVRRAPTDAEIIAHKNRVAR